MAIIGLDAGSVSVKVVVLDETGRKRKGIYREHHGHPVAIALELLRETGAGTEDAIAVTGSAGRLIAEVLGVEPVNEIVAQSCAIQKLHPHIKTIIEMGGEDSKLILMDEQGVRDFSMNSVCAAGTGSFLDQQAERLMLSIDEFSELALESGKPPRIAGRCSVFAKSDMIHLQQIATPVRDIVAGLCFAVARNFKGSIARGRVVTEPVSFQGGVAANKGMARAFREVFGLKDIFIPQDYALMGAWGAALKSRDECLVNRLSLEALEAYISREKPSEAGHRPLRTGGDEFFARHLKDDRDVLHPVPAEKVTAYMGLDIGSISTNLAVIDEHGNLLAKRYLMTSGRPIEAIRRGISEIAAEVGQRVDIKGVGTTGSGRYMIADFVGADIVKNEITAQATAAAFIDPGVDTIFEIGGQDSKYISLRDGVIVDFEMNKACAAGTGSFLEEQAEKLDISVKQQFAECAFSAECPTRLGERCTVFMENSLMANLQRGADRNDLLAGLAYSIVQNYLNRVVAGKKVGMNIFFQGGVAFNKSVVAAFEKYLGVSLTVPPNHDVTGAIGMALIAMRHMLETGKTSTSFKGFDLSRAPYEISSFGCKGCSNQCEINRVKIEGEKSLLFYGGRCEKYDINRKNLPEVPDLFQFRSEMLWKSVAAPGNRGGNGNGSAPKARLGLPYVFFLNEYLPFWSTLLQNLGFEIVVSPKPNREIVDMGLESVVSETCFPAKVALGHIRFLHEQGVDAILVPSFKNFALPGDEYSRSVACPYTQTLPYMSRIALPEVNVLDPVVDITLGNRHLMKELKRVLAPFAGMSSQKIRQAMNAAERVQAEFYEALKAKGREVLSNLTEKAIVIVGRSYNAFERGMNLQLPEKLATLGVLSIPMDMLPTDDDRLTETWPSMYWRSGQRILRAARFIRKNELLYPILIGNFSCGPDSFIIKYFREELGDKPFLHIEIDEHSADAGAVTRCEAFLDSIEKRRDLAASPPTARMVSRVSGRTVYIPRMADHAFAIKAAFERSGVRAEVMPESDHETVDVGMRYASGKECYPFILTTGDMVKITELPDFDPDRAAFFMPSGNGPCRFGNYNIAHRKVLEHIGLVDVPVFSPNQDEGLYRDFGIVDKDFAMTSWKGIMAIEMLTKCLHETRPYELQEGVSDALYSRFLDLVYVTLRDDPEDMVQVLGYARRQFEAVPRSREPRPLIGLIGEVYVRLNRFANDDLIRRIEKLGGEVWLAPFEEWVYYINLGASRRAFQNKEWSLFFDGYLKRFVQKKVDRNYSRVFEGFLKTLHEPDTRDILKMAAPFVPDTFEGEATLSIGKSIDLIRHGAAGIVNAIPFGCMPGTIVTALVQGLEREYNVPFITMPYDGTVSSTLQIQLEAFMDQAKNRAAQRQTLSAGPINPAIGRTLPSPL